MERIFVTVCAAFAVRQDDRFVVVDKTDSRAEKVVFHELPLDSGGNREAKIHFLKILLGDVQGFRVIDSFCLETVIEGIYRVLEILALGKAKKRDRRLHKDGQDGIVVVQFFFTGGKGYCRYQQ